MIKKVGRIHKCNAIGNTNYKKGTITAKLRLGDNPRFRFWSEGNIPGN